MSKIYPAHRMIGYLSTITTKIYDRKRSIKESGAIFYPFNKD